MFFEIKFWKKGRDTKKKGRDTKSIPPSDEDTVGIPPLLQTNSNPAESCGREDRF